MLVPFFGYGARKLLSPERDITAVAWSGIRVVEPDEAFVYRGVNKSGRLGGLRISESEATSYRCVSNGAIIQKPEARMLVDGFDLFIRSH